MPSQPSFARCRRSDRSQASTLGSLALVAVVIVLLVMLSSGTLAPATTPPVVTWEVTVDDDPPAGDQALVFTHDGGDAIESAGFAVTPAPGSDHTAAYEAAFDDEGAYRGSDERLTAGDRVVLPYDEDDVDPGDEIRLHWSPEGTDTTHVVGVQTAPEE